MVSSIALVSACLLAVAAAAPQFRTALSPSYQHLGVPVLPYQAPAAYPYQPAPVVRNTPLPAYHQPALSGVAPRTAAILSQTQDLNFDGTFNFGFQSEDGTSVQTSGAQRALSPEEAGHAASGSYSYIAPDGTPITTTWYADETGFHAQGDHLPKGPEGHVRAL